MKISLKYGQFDIILSTFMKTIELPFRLKVPVLACGADIKGAFALAKGDRAYLEEGFGDLSDPDNLAGYRKSLAGLGKRLSIKPGAIACDLHQGYFSTRFAERLHGALTGSKFCRVQHHEAHIASVITDNAIKGSVIGVAFDGTGYGSDGNIWGGEFFTGSPKSFAREGHLDYVAMPGADAAVREPWRMAASYLYKVFGDTFSDKVRARGRGALIKTVIDKKINSPLTSGAGRLFDAAASLILGREKASYEAELPIELERLVRSGYEERYEINIVERDGMQVVDTNGIIRGIARDLSRGVDRHMMAGRFHNSVVEIVVKMVLTLAKKRKIRKVAFSGGVFQNRYLREKSCGSLIAHGFDVYTHRNVSTTDSGIPLGQITIASARSRCV